MASSSMSIAMSSTASSAAATSSTPMAGMDMSGKMDMGGDACNISMLWNWYTVNACFLSSSWHVTSPGMFAGSCIGVICLVLSLEFLRRLGKEYDRFLLREFQERRAPLATRTSSSDTGNDKNMTVSTVKSRGAIEQSNMAFKPNLRQQATRALLHMLQFAVAYFIMLLAMYYNGYIIICIFIGAYIGFFIFSWDSLSLARAQEEVTVCCG